MVGIPLIILSILKQKDLTNKVKYLVFQLYKVNMCLIFYNYVSHVLHWNLRMLKISETNIIYNVTCEDLCIFGNGLGISFILC